MENVKSEKDWKQLTETLSIRML